MHDLIELIIIIVYFVGLPLSGAWLIWRSHPAPVATGAVLARMADGTLWPPEANGDDLTDLIDATREPSGEATECLITFLPPRIHRDECGCLWLEGGYLSACRPHDPAWEPPVTQWMSEMSE